MAKYPKVISDVRGWGLMNGIEIHPDSKIMSSDITKLLMNAGI